MKEKTKGARSDRRTNRSSPIEGNESTTQWIGRKRHKTQTLVLNCTSHEIPVAWFVAALVSPSSRTILPNRIPFSTNNAKPSQRIVPELSNPESPNKQRHRSSRMKNTPACERRRGESYRLTARIHVRHGDDVVYTKSGRCHRQSVQALSTQPLYPLCGHNEPAEE